MPISIASYFLDELTALDERATVSLNEIPDLKTKVLDIIHRDGIVELATNAEHLLELLSDVKQLFEMLQKTIRKQQNNLKESATIVVSSELRNKQESIRNRMLEAEKNYLDIKYGCLDFLSRTVGH
ncbi:MAG: hypothetical protein WC756_19305 [Taibaiella sp.]|jgi:hypothetical protein